MKIKINGIKFTREVHGLINNCTYPHEKIRDLIVYQATISKEQDKETEFPEVIKIGHKQFYLAKFPTIDDDIIIKYIEI